MIRTSASSADCQIDNNTSCGTCRLSGLCLPLRMHLDDIDRLDRVIQRSRPLQKNQYLYRANDPFRSIYAVRSGTVKATTLTERGQEQITGFYLPGELVGLDGIAENRYTCSVMTLETSSICEIPFARIEELSAQIPSLQRNIFQLLSREITHDQQLISLLSKSSAEQRIAAFLLSLSRRHEARHLAANAFRLPMSRTDMGNFLGLTIETVSRVLSRFHAQGIIQLDKKEVRIADFPRLQELSEANN
ncbi:fumarate/nitrate reduction transcriptional regulator Fnr [Marinimicrobium sp. ABcell2]|uniref:fumarate/nitrate reduction transcriptional regulator Fnr n=1 Tax=Marinimicrobium sp. ABcell2 TaxID=3069751 RepID=UPI0027AFEEEC|nr:fumarate/nitrate reduction transcriptional regulator Fnr [Marinimicrobium sp. ABcell2]MDQ2075209.1 fumarate/nitrate reduction transcriptional regulator Fnr [Marinimicrobium sp. ABcell2]